MTRVRTKMLDASIGQHNDHALRDMLGMSDEEITELAIDGALE